MRIKFQGKGDINITVEFYDVARDIDTTPISQWTPPEKTLVSNSSTEDFSYDLYMNGAKLESSNIVPIIDGYYNEFEIVPRSAGVKAELVDPIVKVAEQPMLVKLTSADGSNSTFSLVKYSKYGETIKKLLYNDLDVVSYDVSSEPETANGRTNMFDNDPSTRFCMYYDDATVTMDLGETKAVDGIALIVWKGDRRNYYFDLQTSTDGINFKTVGNYSSSGEVEDYEFYTFPTEQARYVRSKERILSFRNAQHAWDPKNQRPEMWKLFNTKIQKGEEVRVFPLSNWTEADIWEYIERENIEIPSLYFAKERPVVYRDGNIIMVDDDRMKLRPGEKIEMKSVRFRTLGCYPLTGGVESTADTLPEIIEETLSAVSSERTTRVIDNEAAGSMERRKREGYF